MGFYVPRKIRSFHPDVLAQSAVALETQMRTAPRNRSARRGRPEVLVMNEEVLGVCRGDFKSLPSDIWNHVVASVRDALRALALRLSAAYESGVDSALDHLLNEAIPNAVFALGRDVLQSVLTRERGFLGTTLSCDKCSGSLTFEGNKPRSFLTRLGEITVSRSYYRCGCGHSASPLDISLGIEEHGGDPVASWV